MSNENDVFTVDDIDARIDEIFGFAEEKDKSSVEKKGSAADPKPDSNHDDLDADMDIEKPDQDTDSFASEPESETKTPTLDKTVELTEVAPDMNDPEISFGAEGSVQEDNDDNSSQAKDGTNILDKLNAIVLSMDWEIDDQIMNSFIGEVSKLKKLFREDKFIFPLLQIHNSVGKYISSKKASAHPDSIKLLNSVYKILDDNLNNKKLTDADKSKLIFGEVQKLRKLKKTIGAATPGKAQKPARKKAPKKPAQGLSPDSVKEMIADLKNELAGVIQNEFAKLREEIKK